MRPGPTTEPAAPDDDLEELDPFIAFSDGFNFAIDLYLESPRDFAKIASGKWVMEMDGTLTNIRTGRVRKSRKT